MSVLDDCERFLRKTGQVVTIVPLDGGSPRTKVWLHYDLSVWAESDQKTIQAVAARNGWTVSRRGE